MFHITSQKKFADHIIAVNVRNPNVQISDKTGLVWFEIVWISDKTGLVWFEIVGFRTKQVWFGLKSFGFRTFGLSTGTKPNASLDCFMTSFTTKTV